MKTRKYHTICFLLLLNIMSAQVGIGTASPNASLDIQSSNQASPANNDGILIPKVDAFPATNPTSSQQGMLLYLTTAAGTKLPGFYYWDNTTTLWIAMSASWNTTGNTGTTVASNFFGTIDNFSIAFKTNNNERMRLTNTGNLIINNTTPVSGDVFSTYAYGANDAVNGYSSGSGAAGYFSNSSTGYSGYFSNSGSGYAGYFSSASGYAGYFLNTGANPTSYFSNSGTSNAGYFQQSNSSNINSTLFATTAGNARVINAQSAVTNNTTQIGFFAQGSTGLTAGYANAASVWGQSSGITGGVFLASGASSGTTCLEGAYSGSAGNYNGIGVYGVFSPAAGYGYGVYGSGGKYGVYANGNLGASGTKSYQIDHPLDPENKYLKHFSMESPEVLNMYRGNVVLDNNGEATVSLPDYFNTINKNFSYNLTAIGSRADLFIKEEINSSNQFKIAGGNPNQKISWQVFAERNDAYVKNHPESTKAELDKDPEDKGLYLMPELYKQPKEKGIFYKNKKQPLKIEEPLSNQPTAAKSTSTKAEQVEK